LTKAGNAIKKCDLEGFNVGVLCEDAKKTPSVAGNFKGRKGGRPCNIGDFIAVMLGMSLNVELHSARGNG
jgi:hypothetical protein